MSWRARSTERRDRRRELRRRLADCGLVRGPRRLGSTGVDSWGRRLGRALESLGAAGSLFGRYLACRADHLPAEECLVLDEIPGVGTAEGRVGERLAAELGRPPEELFTVFDRAPFAVSLVDQSHTARLADGQQVVVRLAHSNAVTEEDLETLRELAPAFRDGVCPAGDVTLGELVDHFGRRLAARLDFPAQAAVLEALSRDRVDADLLAVPRVFTSLTGSGVLTVEQLPGARSLDSEPPAGGRAEREELARRFFLMWLEQVLVGGLFPVEAEVELLRDGRLALSAGVWERLAGASQPNLWSYLSASAAHRPEEAGNALLRQLETRTKDASEAALRLRLRQVVPFRDGGWSERGDTVAEHLVLHWRLIRQCGFEPRRSQQAFYEGLFWGARLCRRWAPETDPLREAQEDMRWLASWQQFRQLADPRRMGASFEHNLAALMELPGKLDRILDLATDDGARLRLRLTESHTARRRKNSLATAASLGLVMAALVVMAGRLEELGLAADWAEKLGTVVFLLLGAWLLKTIGGGD